MWIKNWKWKFDENHFIAAYYCAWTWTKERKVKHAHKQTARKWECKSYNNTDFSNVSMCYYEIYRKYKLHLYACLVHCLSSLCLSGRTSVATAPSPSPSRQTWGTMWWHTPATDPSNVDTAAELSPAPRRSTTTYAPTPGRSRSSKWKWEPPSYLLPNPFTITRCHHVNYRYHFF